MHEWKGNEMTATEPTNPFSGAKCWFQGGVHGFFVVGLMCGGWMVGISIACIFLL